MLSFDFVIRAFSVSETLEFSVRNFRILFLGRTGDSSVITNSHLFYKISWYNILIDIF